MSRFIARVSHEVTCKQAVRFERWANNRFFKTIATTSSHEDPGDEVAIAIDTPGGNLNFVRNNRQ
jgi:hypothetical protein